MLNRFLPSLLFAVVTSMLVARAAAAAPAAPADDEPAEAKAHYSKATAHFAVGEYKEAAAEYEAAFKIHQHPALLYNAAQSHRLAGDNQKALLLYKNLVKLYPSTKYAADSKERIDKLERAIATTQSPPNGPAPMDGAAGGAAPGPMAVGDNPTSVRPAAAPVPGLSGAPAPGAAPSPPAASLVAAPAAPAEQQQPIYKKWWFWAGAGAVAVVAVVVVVVASGGSSAWANLPDVHGALSGVRW